MFLVPSCQHARFWAREKGGRTAVAPRKLLGRRMNNLITDKGRTHSLTVALRYRYRGACCIRLSGGGIDQRLSSLEANPGRPSMTHKRHSSIIGDMYKLFGSQKQLDLKLRLFKPLGRIKFHASLTGTQIDKRSSTAPRSCEA